MSPFFEDPLQTLSYIISFDALNRGNEVVFHLRWIDKKSENQGG